MVENREEEDMEDLITGSKTGHKLVMTGRRSCNLTGIMDAVSFDPNEIILETEMGMLCPLSP